MPNWEGSLPPQQRFLRIQQYLFRTGGSGHGEFGLRVVSKDERQKARFALGVHGIKRDSCYHVLGGVVLQNSSGYLELVRRRRHVNAVQRKLRDGIAVDPAIKK